MADQRLRELERRWAAGEDTPEIRARLGAEQLRAGVRDPRRWPRPGDVVRVPMHGADGLRRWDERRVVSCQEAAGWEPDKVHVCTLFVALGTPVSFAANSPALHWERSYESMRVLLGWRLARERRGTMMRLGSWRSWARLGEVLVVALDPGGR